MRTADVLATAASTFSFSAAMLAHEVEHDLTPELAPELAPEVAHESAREIAHQVAHEIAREIAPPPHSTPPGSGARPGRFWRPDPAAGALVEFDPWGAPVLLNACHSGTRFRREAHAAGADG